MKRKWSEQICDTVDQVQAFLAKNTENQMAAITRGDEIKTMGWQFSIDAFRDNPEYAVRFGDDDVPNYLYKYCH